VLEFLFGSCWCCRAEVCSAFCSRTKPTTENEDPKGVEAWLALDDQKLLRGTNSGSSYSNLCHFVKSGCNLENPLLHKEPMGHVEERREQSLDVNIFHQSPFHGCLKDLYFNFSTTLMALLTASTLWLGSSVRKCASNLLHTT